MRRVTIRELHQETGRIVDQAATGEVIVIQRRGVPVAELRGASMPRSSVKVPDLQRRYARFPRVKTDSGRFLEEDRR
jgi:prevent-host-death family protein